MIVGIIDGLIDVDGAAEGDKVGEDGAEVGVSDRGSELQVDRPEFAHAGYTQAGGVFEGNGVVPNVIPAQYSMIAILSVLQARNASVPIDLTLLGILIEVSELQ